MTVTSTSRRSGPYTGNGVTTVFTVGFKFLSADLLRVIRTDTTTGVQTVLTHGTDYTRAGAGNPSGGSITCTVAPTSTQTITIVGNLSPSQETDYVENDPFPAAAHEDALDKLTMLVQQDVEKLARAVTLPESSTLSNITLPLPAASRLIGWNGDADELTNYALSTVTDDTIFATPALADAGKVAKVNSTGDAYDLTASPLGSAAFEDIGTSGDALGKLNANKTDSGNNTYSGTAAFTGPSLSYARSGATPTLTLSREDAQAALTAISYITTTGKNDAGALLNVIRLVNYFTNVASGSEETRTQIESYIAGAATVIARFGPGVSFGNPTGGVPTTAGQLNITGLRINNVLQPRIIGHAIGSLAAGVLTVAEQSGGTLARTGAGDLAFTFSSAEANTNYIVLPLTMLLASANGAGVIGYQNGAKSTTGFTLRTGTYGGTFPEDAAAIEFVILRVV